MHSPSGLAVSLTPTRYFRVLGQSLLGRRFKMYRGTPLPHIQSRCYNGFMLCGVARCASSNGNKKISSTIISSMFMQFELPALECLFKEKCHPEYECIRNECDAWTLSLFDPTLPSHDLIYVYYLKGLYPLFTSLFFSFTPSQRRLVLLTKLSNWLFIFDDILENADLQTMIELTHGLKSIFESTPRKRSLNVKPMRVSWPCFPRRESSFESFSRTRYVRAFMDRLKHEVWEEMCTDMTQSNHQKFLTQISSSLNGQYQHEQMRQKRKSGVEEGQTLAMDDLMEIRLRDSFSWPLIGALMEYALDIDLEDILQYTHSNIEEIHEKVENLKHVAACHTTWTNDLFSFHKEIFKDECLSIVVVLMKQRGINALVMDEKGAKMVQEVIQEVWGMIKEQERIGACLLEEIKKCHGLEPYAHEQLVKYCEALCVCMAGNMYWSTLTARYNGLHPLPWKTPTSLIIPYDNTFPTLDFLQFLK